jgi:asparagine synthase (glutamine-hydrolysing)
MCGIAGVVERSAESQNVDRKRHCAAMQNLTHRGPDGRGEYADGQLWFGHLRLSILDVSESGRQPMRTEDGRFTLCYNGEVYNFRELAAGLSLKLRSRSDSEVVLRAFAARGPESLLDLRGIFAFAIYDKARQKVWLVRDRLGVKPLYYALDDNGLVFASEIKAILALRSDTAECDVSALHEWLYYGNTLGGRTLYHGIEQLLPGHYLELDISSFDAHISQYWSLQHEAAQSNGSHRRAPDVIAETRRLVEQAVRRQLVSDVPVGVFLSGGVDSTAITAFAAKHYQGRLATYSAGFDDRNGVDERPKARRIASLYGTEHHELHITGGDVPALVEKMVHHHDQPFSDAANIPLYQMASQISGRTKVVLQGDGGDELFGGYRRYVTLRQARLLQPLARSGRPLTALVPDANLRHRVRRYLQAFAPRDLGCTMALLLTLENADTAPEAVFSPRVRQLLERSNPFARYQECQRRFSNHDIGNQMSFVDLTILLPDIFLEKVDRATMAAGVEVRVPLLDDDLVSYVVRVPGPVKMPWGRKKWLLKQAVAGIVPDDVLNGRKTGFNVPFGYWLRTALKPFFFDHLATFDRQQPGVLDRELLTERYARFEAGRVEHSHQLWKMLNFLVWCNNSSIAIAP